MGIMEPVLEKRLRHAFKSFNRFMLLMWRLGLGQWVNAWPQGTGCIMVLTHHGRKSGRQYHTPLNYAEIDGDIYCTAGFGSDSDWYLNVCTNPQVQIWLPEGWWVGRAQDVSDTDEALGKIRSVVMSSGFAARAAGIDPVTMSDADLRAATADYRLVRINRTKERTGNGGPGELAWIWPLVAGALFIMLLFPRPTRRDQ